MQPKAYAFIGINSNGTYTLDGILNHFIRPFTSITSKDTREINSNAKINAPAVSIIIFLPFSCDLH